MPDICVWNKCNNKCVMCTNSGEFSRSAGKGVYNLKSQITKWKQYCSGAPDIYVSSRKNYINLTGGEPTIHPDFFSILWFLRKKSPEMPITLLSNGRKFKDPPFAEKFSSIALPPFSVGVALHAADAGTFDRITGVKGSFSETVEGIKNLFRFFRGRVEFRMVLHGLNVKKLPETLSFVKSNFSAWSNWHIRLIHYEIEGMAEANRRKIFLKLTDSAKAVERSLKSLEGLDFEMYHWPLCCVPEKLRPYCRITLPLSDRVFTEKCSGCRLRKKCLGLMKDYCRLYGDGELKAVRKP